MSNDDESRFMESLENPVNFIKTSVKWSNVKAYASTINPGSKEMIGYLRWAAMEAVNHACRRRIAAGLPFIKEENMPHDYWISKTKEIAAEKILRDFKGKGLPESLADGSAFYSADVIRGSIEQTIEMYGKMPYIDEPEFRKKAETKATAIIAVLLCMIIGCVGFVVFKQVSPTQQINPSIKK